MYRLAGNAPIGKGGSIGWLLLLALLGAILLVVAPRASELLHRGSFELPAPVRSRPAGEEADILRHLELASAAQRRGLAALAHSQQWADGALSSLDDPAVAARRLQLARAASVSAASDIERGREECEIVKGLLTERTQSDGK